MKIIKYSEAKIPKFNFKKEIELILFKEDHLKNLWSNGHFIMVDNFPDSFNKYLRVTILDYVPGFMDKATYDMSNELTPVAYLPEELINKKDVDIFQQVILKNHEGKTFIVNGSYLQFFGKNITIRENLKFDQVVGIFNSENKFLGAIMQIENIYNINVIDIENKLNNQNHKIVPISFIKSMEVLNKSQTIQVLKKCLIVKNGIAYATNLEEIVYCDNIFDIEDGIYEVFNKVGDFCQVIPSTLYTVDDYPECDNPILPKNIPGETFQERINKIKKGKYFIKIQMKKILNQKVITSVIGALFFLRVKIRNGL